MRGVFRYRRRRKDLLFGLLLLCLFAALLPWVSSQRELLYRQFKTFLEEEGGQTLGLEVQIGALQTTPWGEGVIRGISFGRKESPPLFSVQEVHIPFDLWRWIRRGPRPDLHLSFKKGLFLKEPCRLTEVEGDLLFQTAPLSRIGLSRGSLLGRWELFQEEGKFRFLFRRRNPLWLEGKLWLDGKTSGSFKVALLQEQAGQLEGTRLRVSSLALFLNDQPAGSLRADVGIGGESLLLKEIRWEKSLRFSGTISRRSPYPVAGEIRLDVPRETLAAWGRRVAPEELPQRLRARVGVRGPLQHLRVQGRLEAEEGRLQGMAYEWVHGTMYGHWPYLTLEAAINHGPSKGFSFTRGLLDLKAFGKDGWYKTVEVEPTHELAVWKDLEIRSPQEDVLVIGKSNGRETVRFKTFLEEGAFGKEEDALEVEYQLPARKVLKMRIEERDSFLGLGHKAQF